jgi:hypothetical protein
MKGNTATAAAVISPSSFPSFACDDGDVCIIKSEEKKVWETNINLLRFWYKFLAKKLTITFL